jgi:hypothetical protein
MKTPAAMARIARITEKPAIEMNADNPVSTSHMANRIKPILRLYFMEISFCRVVKLLIFYVRFDSYPYG